MKKSILFSSIATTCCLLIQHSASAEWASFSGTLFLNANSAFPPGAQGRSNISNNWSNSIYYYNFGSGSSSTSLTTTNLNANCGASSPFDGGYGSASIFGTLNFYIAREGIITFSASAPLSNTGTSSVQATLESVIEGVHTSLINITANNWNSDSYSITIMPNIEYQMTLSMSSSVNGQMGSTGNNFNMSITPAPAASALLALAGLVSRRRRA